MTPEERAHKACELHSDHHNCCQSVVLAFDDKIGIDEAKANQLASTFGMGMSGLREVCGCVSGMAMVAGMAGHSVDFKSLAERFRQENGDIVCGRLLASGKRPCREYVGCAARLLSSVCD
ncbi:MAG: C_GCAxxG_C_C family protein [Bacteroidales bacterium]|nr:C_GCAxxG_C_C family protein [Bacteroidales bacterium]